MNFDVVATETFERKVKKLSKKYRSIILDLAQIIDELSVNPTLGTPLGKDCYKIRVAITSKGKGKSGGARLITFIRVSRETVYLLDLYDKSEQDTISDNELKLLIDLLQ